MIFPGRRATFITDYLYLEEYFVNPNFDIFIGWGNPYVILFANTLSGYDPSQKYIRTGQV